MSALYKIGDQIEFTQEHIDDMNSNFSYLPGAKGFVQSIIPGTSIKYVIKRGMTEIKDVPEDHIKLANKEVMEAVQRQLDEAQKVKDFKDVGKRVSGSAKESRAYAKIVFDDLKDIEEDELTAQKLVVKEKVYPEVNVPELKQSGVTSGAAYLIVKIREACGNKPPNNAKKRAAYVKFIEKINTDLKKCLTVSQIYELFKGYKLWQPEEVMGYLFEPDWLNSTDEFKEKLRVEFKKKFPYHSVSTILEQAVSEIFGKRFANFIWFSSDAAHQAYSEAKMFERVTAEQEEENWQNHRIKTNKFIDANKVNQKQYIDANHEELKKLSWNWQMPSEYKKDMEVFRKRCVDYYQKRIDDGQKSLAVLPVGQRQREESWSWFEAPKERKEAEKSNEPVVNSGIPLAYIKRTGGLLIDEKFVNAATSTDPDNNPITKVFGFSSIQYGNALRDVEAKQHVKHFLGAMSDFAEILGFDIAAMNKLGGLSIAFAARGKRGAAAHYESGRKIINLTNRNGDGTVAHEYAHFLDNMLTMLGSTQVTTKYASDIQIYKNGFSGRIKKANMVTNQAVNDAMVAIMNFIMEGKDGFREKYKERIMARPNATPYSLVIREPGSYSSRNIEIVPVGDTIEEAITHYRGLTKYFRTLEKDILEYQKKVLGKLVADYNLPYYDFEFEPKTSLYYHYSSLMSSKYWIEPWELFARAFETYIQDKLNIQKRSNNYLVSLSLNYAIPTKAGYTVYVYPLGLEREYLFVLYDNLIEAIKGEYNLPAFTPFTDVRQDEYLALDTTDNQGIDAGVTVTEQAPPVENFTPTKKLTVGQKEIRNEVVKTMNEVIANPEPLVSMPAENIPVDDNKKLIASEATEYLKKNLNHSIIIEDASFNKYQIVVNKNTTGTFTFHLYKKEKGQHRFHSTGVSAMATNPLLETILSQAAQTGNRSGLQNNINQVYFADGLEKPLQNFSKEIIIDAAAFPDDDEEISQAPQIEVEVVRNSEVVTDEVHLMTKVEYQDHIIEKMKVSSPGGNYDTPNYRSRMSDDKHGVYYKSIQDALREGLYPKAIEVGKITAQKAKDIIEESGLTVPQQVYDLAQKEQLTLQQAPDKKKYLWMSESFADFKRQMQAEWDKNNSDVIIYSYDGREVVRYNTISEVNYSPLRRKYYEVIKYAIETDKYLKLIQRGEATPEMVEKIIKAASEEVPKNILELMPTKAEAAIDTINQAITDVDTLNQQKKLIMSNSNKIKINNRYCKNWEDVPNPWKVVKPVSKVKYECDPEDKGLVKIVAPYCSTDDLRPAMAGIYFGEKAILATDAHRLMCMPNTGKIKNNKIYNISPKIKNKIATVKGKNWIDARYPDFQAVIPEKSEYVSKVDVYKLKTYCEAVLAGKYPNESTKQITFQVRSADKENNSFPIAFNAEFLIEICETFLQLGHETIYAGFSSPFRAGIFSAVEKVAAAPHKNIGKELFVLCMPLMINSNHIDRWKRKKGEYVEDAVYYGAQEIDFDTEIQVYYSFEDDEIHNADGSVAKFDCHASRTDVPYATQDEMALLKNFLSENTVIVILEYVCVRNGVAMASDLETFALIDNFPVEDGLYELVGGALKDVAVSDRENIENYPLPHSDKKTKHKIGEAECASLAENMSEAAKYVSNDDLRPAMTGVQIYSTDDNTTYLRGTNAHYLYIKEEAGLKLESAKYIISQPKGFAKALQYMGSGNASMYIGMEHDEITHIFFEKGNIRLEHRLIDARYPDVIRVLPDYLDRQLVFSRKELHKMVSALKGSDMKGTILIFDIPEFKESGGKIKIKLYLGKDEKDEDVLKELGEISYAYKEIEKQLPPRSLLCLAQNQTPIGKFSFDPKYVKQVFATLEGDDAVMKFNHEKTLLVIFSLANEVMQKSDPTLDELLKAAKTADEFIGNVQRAASDSFDHDYIDDLNQWDIEVNGNYEDKGKFGKFPKRGWFEIARDYFDSKSKPAPKAQTKEETKEPVNTYADLSYQEATNALQKNQGAIHVLADQRAAAIKANKMDKVGDLDDSIAALKKDGDLIIDRIKEVDPAVKKERIEKQIKALTLAKKYAKADAAEKIEKQIKALTISLKYSK